MRRLAAVAVASLALFALTPVPAHAQFGGLIKRAVAKRAAEEIVKQPGSGKAGKRELTDDQVTKLLAGLTAEARSANEIGRAAIAEHGDAVRQIDSYLAKQAAYEKSRAEATRQVEAYSACTGAHTEALTAAAQGASMGARPDAMALMQKMQNMSPAESDAFQAKLDALEARAEAAKKSGDVVEQQRVRADIGKLTGINMSAPAAAPMSAANVKKAKDAAAGIQKCGSVPRVSVAQAPDPVMVRRVLHASGGDSLETEANQTIQTRAEASVYTQQLRLMSLGDKPAEQGAAAAGMSKGAYSLMREEVLYFYVVPVMRGQSPRAGAFGEAELSVLDAHRSELIAAAKHLQEVGTLE